MSTKVELTIALPAELAERIDKFVAETRESREQIALKMLERALFSSMTPSECAKLDAEMVEGYESIARDLENEGWVW